MKLSNRARTTAASPLRSLVLPESVHIHKLNIGQPDISSPKEFFDGLHSFTEPVVAYDAAVGNPKLIDRWTNTLNKQYGLSLTKSEMVITTGSSEALMFLFSVCCDVNDDVLVFSPSYANYSGFAALAGVNLVPIDCSFDANFHPPNVTGIESHITEHTKAILVCNPNNPSGTLLTHDELKLLIGVCEKHDLFLIVDEVYREFVYEVSPSCILQIAPKHERIIIIDSLSKRYSLCGARIGCIISHNKEVIAAATNLASTRVSAPSLEQFAAAHMFENLSETYIRDVVAEYKARRDVLVSGLKLISGVELNAPEGGFYALVKLPVDDARDFAQFMVKDFSMNDETVCISPASGFFFNTKPITNYARIAFVVSIPELQRSVKIIEHALIVYTSKN
jgi:aspartate aminotransferase